MLASMGSMITGGDCDEHYDFDGMVPMVDDLMSMSMVVEGNFSPDLV